MIFYKEEKETNINREEDDFVQRRKGNDLILRFVRTQKGITVHYLSRGKPRIFLFNNRKKGSSSSCLEQLPFLDNALIVFFLALARARSYIYIS